jgi:ornithine carbamoyltransferase
MFLGRIRKSPRLNSTQIHEVKMSKKIIDLTDLSHDEIEVIWALAENLSPTKMEGTIAWSFEGNGIRTRSSFIKAFQMLGLNYIELPNLLKTSERPEDLAGYLDSFYEAYIIRESNHERLSAFMNCSEKPVVNAMSDRAHPCEVLTDAFFINKEIKKIKSAKILLWGPLTNVFLSWYALAEVMDFTIYHYCPEEFRRKNSNVKYIKSPLKKVDVVITDW